TSDAGGAGDVDLSAADSALLDRLKAWRLSESRTQSVPAYVILHDKTLAEIARLRPPDLPSLHRIAGIGAAKLERYGAALVALLVPTVAACFWIRHGLRMVREKTNDRPGHRPLFDTQLIEGPPAVRGGWMEVAAGTFVILACAFLLLWPLIGAESSVFLRHPS